ncbi:MAG: hypothetical protein K6G12_02520 [Lachnospiraceae bacterium]|nr:hypothetical protein [Lachnospiraceae bacterium]
MLTVKAPIELRSKSSYISDPEAFYHRIIGNYSLMETHINEEDLLHISATPPEIYVQEGGAMTSIVANNEHNETNLQKVQILNNVLNRIVMSADAHLTYQERVFITDTLYKLGIHDDRKFMNAFYRMAEETKNTNTLIDLYLERGGEVRELIEAMESRIRSTEHTEETDTLREKENYLYQTIMERLRTGAIYQIVSNFNRSTDNSEIDRREYSVSDQTYIAQHILLSVLRDRAGMGGENLIFLTGNTYEENLEQEEVSATNVRNEINAAVLMDMLSNIYHTGYDRFYTNADRFYRFEDVFYGSSVSLLNRLTQYQGDVSFTMRASETMITEQSTLMADEITLLERDEESGEISEDELVRITKQVNEMNVLNEQRRQQYMQVLEQIRRRTAGESRIDSMEKTRQTGILALTSPEAMMEQLNEEEQARGAREKLILHELARVFPENAFTIYEMLSNYEENPQEFINNNIIRPADEGELIHDIREVEREAAQETLRNARNALADAEELTERVSGTRHGAGSGRRIDEYEFESVPTIHRRTETLSQEEVEEQLSNMYTDLSHKIETVTSQDTVNERHTTNTQTVISHDTVNQGMSEYEIRKMIDAGVKNQVSAISNQVFRKLENQMRNEKIRRGY